MPAGDIRNETDVRTPRHIIRLMVEMMEPTATDVMCDPARGASGFLMAAGEYLRERHPETPRHGAEGADIRDRDWLAQEQGGADEKYTLVLARAPFAGSADRETIAKDLLAVVETERIELLFLARVIRLLKPGGRAAVIVPDGVLFGSSEAHTELRRMLVEDQKLEAMISLPGGVFRPHAGDSAAILALTKTNAGGTDHVWVYDVDADGWSLDDRRMPLLPDEKLGPLPKQPLTADEHGMNNLPDVLARWGQRTTAERERPRDAQSFCVPKAEIVAAGYDLSLNRGLSAGGCR